MSSFECEISDSFCATPSSMQKKVSQNSQSSNLLCDPEGDIKENVDRLSQCSSVSTSSNKRLCSLSKVDSSHSSRSSSRTTSEQRMHIGDGVQMNHLVEGVRDGEATKRGDENGELVASSSTCSNGVAGCVRLSSHDSNARPTACHAAETCSRRDLSEAQARDSTHEGMCPGAEVERY